MPRTRIKRRLSNRERIERKTKPIRTTDWNQKFEFFGELPADLKIETLKYIPFYNWTTALSCVCKEWSTLLRKATCPKILETSYFYYHGHKSDFLVHVARSFQITGLDMAGFFMHENYEPNFKDVVKSILSASSAVTYVNLVNPYEKGGPLPAQELPYLPATITKLYTKVWDTIGGKDLPNLTHLHVAQLEREYLRETILSLRLPMLQELRIDDLKGSNLAEVLPLLKKMAPNLKAIYVGISYASQDIPEDECIQLEKLASTFGFELYCRNLFTLIGNDTNRFIDVFKKQKIPYSYYSTVTETLLSQACEVSDIQVVKFLLDNNFTNLDNELDLNLNNLKPTFLLPDSSLYEDEENECSELIEYLLQHPDYHPEHYNGAAAICQTIETNQKILFMNRKFNLLGSPIIHHLVTRNWLDLLNYQLEGLSQDQIRAVLASKDALGNTPLQYAARDQNIDLCKRLIQLGANIGERGKWLSTPLLLLKTTGESIIALLELVPVIPTNVVIEYLCKVEESIQVLNYLVKQRGVDLNAIVDGDPLFWACNPIQQSKLQVLRDLGADLTKLNDKGYSLLFQKKPFSDDYVSYLVHTIGLDINHLASDSLTPLTFALENESEKYGVKYEKINLLLQHGAKVQEQNQQRAWKSMINFLTTVINQKAELTEDGYDRDGQYDTSMPALMRLIKVVLESGIDLNEPTEEHGNMTRMMQLCLAYDKERVRINPSELTDLLIRYGANLNIKDANGNTLVHMVQSCRLLRSLVDSGLDPHAVNSFGETACFYAGEDKIKQLLNGYGLDVNHVTAYGSPLIHYLLTNKKLNEVLALLNTNLDLLLVDGCGRSVAHFLNYASKEVVDEIIKSAFNLEQQRDQIRLVFQSVDKFGHSALYYAVQLGYVDVVQQLADAFDLEMNCPSEDQTPLHLSVSLPMAEGYDITAFLLSRGANVNAQSLDGNTPLHLAASYKSKDYHRTKQLLLENGASVTIKNKFNVSPLDLDPTLKAIDTNTKQ